MLTGDNVTKQPKPPAQKVGIKRVISQVFPQEKSRVNSDLQAEEKSVIMAGDGINDAPAPRDCRYRYCYGPKDRRGLHHGKC